jgi:hypothetical protein
MILDVSPGPDINAVRGIEEIKEGTMKTMGKYCKAYPLGKLREFREWTENASQARMEKKLVNGEEIEGPRELNEDSYLYLQDNFTVTDDIFRDQNIVFDHVSPQWIEFCKNTLNFEVPAYQSDAPENGQ